MHTGTLRKRDCKDRKCILINQKIFQTFRKLNKQQRNPLKSTKINYYLMYKPTKITIFNISLTFRQFNSSRNQISPSVHMLITVKYKTYYWPTPPFQQE